MLFYLFWLMAVQRAIRVATLPLLPMELSLLLPQKELLTVLDLLMLHVTYKLLVVQLVLPNA